MNNKEKQYFKEVEIIEKKYSEIMKHIHFKYPKPINLNEEKKKFFSAIADDKYYNPQIKFEKSEIDLKYILKLKKLKLNYSNDLYGFKKLYKKKIKAKLIQIKYHKLWGDPKAVKYVLKYWGKPSYFLFRKAVKYCKNFHREKVKFTKITTKIAAKELRNEVKKLTGDDIKIQFTTIPSKVNIEPHEKLIQFNCNEQFTTLDVKRLKVHEIGVHYMRYFNGSKFNLKILETGTSNYIETEEGLATYCEYLMGVSSKAQMFIYAGRVIGTYYSTKKSFYEIFEILKSYNFTDEVAFAISYRVKRNLCDTSQKGGFTKDFVYFKGFFKVEKFAKNNKISDLFIGKIKIDDLKLLKKFINKNRNKIITIFK